MTDAEAILRWLAVLTAISVAFAPVVWSLAAGTNGAGGALVRPLGLILLTGICWWPAAALNVPFHAVTLYAVLLLAGVAAWTFWLRSGATLHWRSALTYESVWLILFSGYAFFRTYHPAIANTEKPMEIALLSSISRSTEVPAPDPWFAGEAINYYYFGYQMIAALVKMSGVPPAIAFNLALATLFASTGAIVAGVGYSLASRLEVSRYASILIAAIAAFLVLLAGNLETASRLIRNPGETWRAGWWYDGVGWEASRVIVDVGVHGRTEPRQTINEFPAFSFVLGDLHPHVLTYPLLLAVTAIALGFMWSYRALHPAAVAVAGALVGLLYVSNSWDAPLGFILISVAIAVACWRDWARIWKLLGVAAASAAVMAAPFLLTFTAPVGVTDDQLPAPLGGIPVIGTLVRSLGVVTWRPSDTGELLTVHGHWLIACVAFVLLVVTAERHLLSHMSSLKAPIAVAALCMTVVAVAWAPAAILAGIPFAASSLVAVNSRRLPVRAVAILFSAGWMLVLVPEFVYIQDAFGDRMNTVFKLYFQAWSLLALATAGTIAVAMGAGRYRLKVASIGTLTVVLLAVAPYAPISARDWTTSFEQRQSLDGAAYISRAAPAEAEMIAWLNENADDDAMLVEAPGCSYLGIQGVPTSRMSAFTGIPTLIGWEGHENQWRRGEEGPLGDRIDLRQEAANRWLDGEEVLNLDLPAPAYIVLGLHERTASEACAPLRERDISAVRARLETQGWNVVFESGNSMILAR